MQDAIERLQRRYAAFKKGEASVLAVKDEAQAVLEAAKKSDNQGILEEVEDILIDLEFSIEENKCKCHRKTPRC
jgi:phosphoribosyl-ATP pyrophosphohydrolase